MKLALTVGIVFARLVLSIKYLGERPPMLRLRHILAFLKALFATRSDLTLENIALQHQIGVAPAKPRKSRLLNVLLWFIPGFLFLLVLILPVCERQDLSIFTRGVWFTTQVISFGRYSRLFIYSLPRSDWHTAHLYWEDTSSFHSSIAAFISLQRSGC